MQKSQDEKGTVENDPKELFKHFLSENNLSFEITPMKVRHVSGGGVVIDYGDVVLKKNDKKS